MAGVLSYQKCIHFMSWNLLMRSEKDNIASGAEKKEKYTPSML